MKMDTLNKITIGLIALGIGACSYVSFLSYKSDVTPAESSQVLMPMSTDVCAHQIAPEMKDYLKKTRTYVKWSYNGPSSPWEDKLKKEANNCKDYVYDEFDLKASLKEEIGFGIYRAKDTRYIAIPEFSRWSKMQSKDVIDWANYKTRMSEIEKMALETYCPSENPGSNDNYDNYYATMDKLIPILTANAPSWESDKNEFASDYWSNNIHKILLNSDCSITN